MVTLAIDETLDTELELVSTRKGRSKSDIVAEVLRRYVQTEQRRHQPLDPALIAAYSQLAEEDIALAEAGMEDYQRQLEEADNA